MIPGRSHSSTKLSGVHLNESRTGASSSAASANNFSPTLKHKSAPHCTFSVACGSRRQWRRIASMSIVCSCVTQFGPSSNHYHLGIGDPKATPFHITLRAAAGKRADDRLFGALPCRFPETAVNQGGLYSPAAKLGASTYQTGRRFQLRVRRLPSRRRPVFRPLV